MNQPPATTGETAPLPPAPGNSSLMAQGQPQLIFFSLQRGEALRRLLLREGLLEHLAAQQYGIALALLDLDDTCVEVVRMLNRYGIYTVAWLLLSADEGVWLNLQNYPQAIERYQALHHWARDHNLHFDAVGLDIEPPASELSSMQRWRLHDIARRLWLARENVLYPAAHSAYTDLVSRMRHDGYEVHTYHLPLIADDQRAGTTLLQRALDVIDLPADMEVLLCYSSLPLPFLNQALGGALIASYGPTADSLAVGTHSTDTLLHPGKSDMRDMAVPSFTWDALERDLLLAASYTDTVYVSSLEGCVESGLLSRIASLDWGSEPLLLSRRRLLVQGFRAVLLVVLLLVRFYRALFAWTGWLLALWLLVRQRRRAAQDARQPHPETPTCTDTGGHNETLSRQG